MSGDEAKLTQFCSMTGAPRDAATALLEAYNGDLEQAVNAFFEDGPPDAPEPVAAPLPPPSSVAPPAPDKKAAPRKASQGNIRGFADLGGEEDSDEDKPIETFIGGAKRHVLSTRSHTRWV